MSGPHGKSGAAFAGSWHQHAGRKAADLPPQARGQFGVNLAQPPDRGEQPQGTAAGSFHQPCHCRRCLYRIITRQIGDHKHTGLTGIIERRGNGRPQGRPRQMGSAGQGIGELPVFINGQFAGGIRTVGRVADVMTAPWLDPSTTRLNGSVGSR